MGKGNDNKDNGVDFHVDSNVVYACIGKKISRLCWGSCLKCNWKTWYSWCEKCFTMTVHNKTKKATFSSIFFLFFCIRFCSHPFVYQQCIKDNEKKTWKNVAKQANIIMWKQYEKCTVIHLSFSLGF